MRFALWVGWVAGVLGVLASRPATAQRAAEPPLPLGGVWKGPLPMPGGDLELTVSVVPLTSGAYFAALDVPAQKVSRLVIELSVRGDSVLMWMPEAQSRYTAYFDGARREMRGIWTQPGLKAPVTLEHSAMPTSGTKSGRFAPPYREEEVTFKNPASHLKLAGTLTVPPGAGPFAAVALVSDLGAQNRDGTVGNYRPLGALADYLTRRGLVVLRYDDRGVGKSEGCDADATTADRTTDLQSALNYLRTRVEVNIKRIGAIGHGEGANVALLAAAQPLPPAFVVSLAGYGMLGQQTLLFQEVNQWRTEKMSPTAMEQRYDRQRTMYDIIRQTNAEQAQAIVANMIRQDSANLAPRVVQAHAAAQVFPWKRYFLSFDPIADLALVECPVLLLSGTEDQEAPPSLHLTALEKELKSVNRNVTTKRIPGLNHQFQPPLIDWTMLNGEMHPLFSPVAQETIRQWIAALQSPAKRPTKKMALPVGVNKK